MRSPEIDSLVVRRVLGNRRRQPNAAQLRRGTAILADELDEHGIARDLDRTRHIGAGCVQPAEHGKLVLEPAAEFDGSPECALVADGAGGVRIANNATLLIKGGVAEVTVLPRLVDFQGEIGSPRSGQALQQ